MKNLITIQHTQSMHHTNGMVGSWTDWDLSELGVRQAENIGKKLAEELKGRRYVIYSSDLRRARHTAEIVAEYMGIRPFLTVDLRERNLGKCVGKSVDWMRNNMECQEKTIDDRIFSDAESRRDEWNRLFPFFNRLMSKEEKNILIVSHGDLLSIFHAMWLRMDVEMLNYCELFGMAGGVSFLKENEDGKRIINRLSDMSYLI